MTKIRAFATVLLPLLVLAAPALAANAEPPAFFAACEKPYDPKDRYSPTMLLGDLTPGISWPAWAELLSAQWSGEAVSSEVLYDATEIRRAVALDPDPFVALPSGYGFYTRTDRRYTPQTKATADQTAAYEWAAQLYSAGNPAAAIPLFDEIVKDASSPYRAAAAYTAARAALTLGDAGEAADRIALLISNPALSEFHAAAFHLIGTYAYNTERLALFAARFAEIRHALTAPVDLICSRERLRSVVEEDDEDLKLLLRAAFYGPPWFGPRRQALDALAESDPWFDFLRTIAAPTSFDRSNDWLENVEETSYGRLDRGRKNDVEIARDSQRLTDHARERWLATGNVLWGYALARRTADIQDLPQIRRMLDAVDGLSDSPAIRAAKPALRWHFLRHGIRLLLMQNRADEALAMLKQELPDEYTYRTIYANGRSEGRSFQKDIDAIVTGGVRLFVSRFDMESARHWWVESRDILGKAKNGRDLLRAVDDNNAVWILQDSYEQLRPNPNSTSYDHYVRQFADVLPAERIIAISRLPNLSLALRRDLLMTGWMRLYLLGRWNEVMAELPEVRAAFPELATDIDQINAAWFSTTRHRLFTHMLLRTPGLTSRAVWARPSAIERYSYGNRPRGLFVIDGQNPSDGNWWCALDIDSLKLEVAEVFQGAVQESKYDAGISYYAPYPPGSEPALKRRLEMADRVIAWHPMLKGVDFRELEALSKIESGPRMLSEQAIQWADGRSWFGGFAGEDRLLPETLHLAVRSTRYGCRRQGGHGEYSRAAFVRLHKNFPGSEWAQKTPFWFDKPTRWPLP